MLTIQFPVGIGRIIMIEKQLGEPARLVALRTFESGLAGLELTVMDVLMTGFAILGQRAIANEGVLAGCFGLMA
jgi:hypothetical protein